MPDAFVHVGPIGNRDIVHQFYDHVGHELVGPGRVTTGSRKNFDTLEDLLDNMAGRTETFQVVVCHGNSDSKQGLICPFTRQSPFKATGGAIHDIARMVRWGSRRQAAPAPRPARPVVPHDPLLDLEPSDDDVPPDDSTVRELAAQMGVDEATVKRLVAKFTAVGRHHVEFRGCSIGANLTMLRDYRDAFQALSASAPTCRMFFVTVQPRAVSEAMMTKMSKSPPGTKARRRTFDAKPTAASAGPLILDVEDVDGHTQVMPHSFMVHPSRVLDWAPPLEFSWGGGAAGGGFITQVLWDNTEPSYHVPTDLSYRTHIARV